jgi:exopolysaccharide biosynthesis polyprenyl glycosylphosphotransferase
MHSARRRFLLDSFKVFDLLLVIAAYLGAALSVFPRLGPLSLQQFLSMRVSVKNFVLFGAMIIAWHCFSYCFGLYDSKRLDSRLSETLDILRATSVGTFVLAVASTIHQIQLATPRFLLVSFVLSNVLIIASRLGLRFVLEQVRRRGRNLRHVVVAGTNQRALDFVSGLEGRPELGYRVVGFVDEPWAGLAEFEQQGRPVVANFHTFVQFIRTNVVDELMIALPMRSLYSEAARLAALAEEQGIAVRFLPSIFDPTIKNGRKFEMDPVTHAETSEANTFTAKRVFDFTVALLSLIVITPLLLVVAILIKLTSPGPVFFVQKRVGLNKRIFSMVKFRTMVPDAEQRIREIEHLNEASGAVFKIKNDPRITPIGRFLRRTSIDELPQLFNVLKGDMSMVGPRPLPMRDYERFSLDAQRRRFSVRPGITCLWQVNGRSSIPFEEWMELDLRYVDQWSIWLDLQILCKTIPAVLRGSGAV